MPTTTVRIDRYDGTQTYLYASDGTVEHNVRNGQHLFCMTQGTSLLSPRNALQVTHDLLGSWRGQARRLLRRFGLLNFSDAPECRRYAVPVRDVAHVYMLDAVEEETP